MDKKIVFFQPPHFLFASAGPGTVITTMRMSDGPVSITHEFWKQGGQFIKLRSIKQGL